jgi:pimeloyl-ACP methyl ester carboxylesterase
MSVELHATEYGEGEPVAILHGLFGNGRNWTTFSHRLGAGYRTITFDLRNHGASPWSDTMDYVSMAEDVTAAMRARGHRRYTLIGHSMGGKTAMVAALRESHAVERLVIVDIAPVAYPTSPFAEYVRAMRALDLALVGRRRDADARLAAIVHNPAERGFLLQNLVLGDGPPHWKINLAAIEGALATLADFPTLPHAYYGPALFIAGGKSPSLDPLHEPAVTALFPNAAMARLSEAGHWVHTDQPEEFLALITSFLATRVLGDCD